MKKLCPLLRKPCIQDRCEFWVHLMGMNPQTGQPMDEWSCTFRWLPVLLVENSNQQRQTAASVDKTANQIARSRAEFIAALPEEAKQRLVQEQVHLIDPKTNGQ